jgi:hypothetical protein
MTLWSGLRLGHLTGWRSRHLADADLVGLLVPGSDVPTASDAANRNHLSHCEVCADRSADLQRLLDGLSDTAQADVDSHVSPKRLAIQRDKIVRRLRRSVGPAQTAHVLRFPSLAPPTLTRVHQATRWLTAAAVAGLIVGLGAGQYLHLHPGTESTDTLLEETDTAQNPTASNGPTLASSGVGDIWFALEDEAFLDEVDLMLVTPRIPELDPLDEITPRIREVSVSPW